MNKPFSKLLSKGKEKKLPSSNNMPVKEATEKSKPLIIFGFLISLSSIFLLLYTINNKFG